MRMSVGGMEPLFHRRHGNVVMEVAPGSATITLRRSDELLFNVTAEEAKFLALELHSAAALLEDYIRSVDNLRNLYKVRDFVEPDE